MRERASRMDDTRRRITEAAVQLHTSVGPSETSLAAVAAEAGVTRLTLYRHFPNRDELFAACMSHWRASHPPPEIATWRLERSFEGRLRRGLQELYGWYRENADDLYPVYRDTAFVPEATHRARRENVQRMADAIVGAPRRSENSATLRAALHHVLAFWTWRSLAVDEGCSHAEAVELAARFALAARARRPRLPGSQAGSAATRPGDVPSAARGALTAKRAMRPPR